jgi:hypothetical protein
MSKEKTIHDFNKAVIEAKQEFLNEKVNYNWEYTIKEETLEGMQIFFIANIQNARKIVWHEEMKVVIDRKLYMMDVKTLWEMKQELMKAGL